MKYILSVIVVTLISTPALADVTDKFYLRVDTGAIKHTGGKASYTNNNDVALKSKWIPASGIGVGYNISQEFRIELMYLHQFNPVMSGSNSVRASSSFNRSVKTKARVDALMFRSYFDFYDFEYAKLFAGAGIGASQVSQKDSVTISRNGSVTRSNDISKKKNINLAYSLAGGIGIKINEKTRLDIQYNWIDWGHAKDSSVKYRGHSAIVGLRFDLL